MLTNAKLYSNNFSVNKFPLLIEKIETYPRILLYNHY